MCNAVVLLSQYLEWLLKYTGVLVFRKLQGMNSFDTTIQFINFNESMLCIGVG